jgi:hypothetical protein
VHSCVHEKELDRAYTCICKRSFVYSSEHETVRERAGLQAFVCVSVRVVWLHAKLSACYPAIVRQVFVHVGVRAGKRTYMRARLY